MRRAGVFGAVAVVAAAAAALAVTSAASPSIEDLDTAAHVVPATRAQLSCPGSSVAPDATTTVFAVTPPAGRARPGAGTLALRTTAEPIRPLADVGSVGVPIFEELAESAKPAVTVDGTGALAPGAAAVQATELAGRRAAGPAMAACRPTADDWWFTGIDTNVGSTARLVMSNPTPAVAAVDLTFYGPRGVVSAVGSHGIPIAPNSRSSIDLARFAPGLDAVTMHVKATVGRVTAAVNVARITGVTPAGNEWLASSEPPSEDVLVDAGDGGAGSQRLVITNAAHREALVGVEVLDQENPFIPKGLTGLRLRPGQTIVKDVSTITGDAAAAVHVTTSGAEGAVTAALVSESPRPPLEFSTSSSSPPLSHAAVVPVFDDTSVDIAFSTVEPGGGAVLVQPYDANGDPVGDGERVPVRRSTTQIWSGRLPDHAAYMVVTVLDGDAVQASATYHGKLGQSAIPVVSGTWTITRPAVHPAV